MAGMPPLPGVLADLAPLLDHWGYLAVGALVGVEDFGIPLPGETVMIVASVYAGAGRLNVFGVAAIAWFAAVLGDNLGYWFGRTAGQRLVKRYGRYVFLPPRRVAKAENFFRRHGGKVILVARFIEGMREVNGLIAGIVHMSWPRFLLYNALGAALWVGTWVSVGYLAGQHISALYPAIRESELWLLVATAVLVVALLARRIRRHRRDRHEDHPDDEEQQQDSEDNQDGEDRPDGDAHPDGEQQSDSEEQPDDESRRDVEERRGDEASSGGGAGRHGAGRGHGAGRRRKRDEQPRGGKTGRAGGRRRHGHDRQDHGGGHGPGGEAGTDPAPGRDGEED